MIDFFIRRPIFATVVSLVILFAGGVSMGVLPIAQFPQITPPQVTVASSYPGASSETVSEVITRLIEEQINGVEGMIYMASSSTNDGISSIVVTFEVGYDQDIGAVDVQNRVQQAEARLPDEVQRAGITVTKQSTQMTAVISLTSPDGRYSSSFLGNYGKIHVSDPLLRVSGVGQIINFGLNEYAMRAWLDIDRMASYGLSAEDVIDAISDQNQQVAAGSVGAPPVSGSPAFKLQINTLGRLKTAEEFGDIIIRASPAEIVRLKDIAEVGLGASSYVSNSELTGKPAAQLGVFQLPEANSLTVAQGIQATMAQLEKNFPEGLEWEMTFDSTTFVTASIDDLIVTIFEAVGLVILVIFIFLQSARATIIPLLAIPVSIIGTFAAMLAFDFSINMLTLLGLVLAVGLVVDDAIVVVENVERGMEENKEGLSPAEITSRSMAEVRGPIVATTLVLLAVFVPAAMMPGITGQLYNQFALTIAFSVAISSIVSLSLTPALCAIILRPGRGSMMSTLFKPVNAAINWMTRTYTSIIRGFSRVALLSVFIIGGIIVGTAGLFLVTSSSFVPNEDQGYFFIAVDLPSGASLERTEDLQSTILKIVEKYPEVRDVIQVSGYDFIASVSQLNSAFLIPLLTPWSERTGEGQSANDIIQKLNAELAQIPEAIVIAVNPPAIQGLGTVGGFDLQLQDLNDLGMEALTDAAKKVLYVANKQPYLDQVYTTFRHDVPEIWLDIDRTAVEATNIDLGSLYTNLQAALGSYYVNDFNLYGRVYEVMIQAAAEYRMTPDDILRVRVPTRDGTMVPLSSFSTIRRTAGSNNVAHYNIYDSIQVNGAAAPGYSSGTAITVMEAICDKVLPTGIGYAWSGLTFQEIQAGNLAPYVFALALIAVFLFLAAQYESWTLPVVILMAVPPGVLGALGFLMLRDMPLDVYGQIGLVMLIGLAAKNSILLVEFAKQHREAGNSVVEAAVEAASLRLRPILMTALAFGFGVLPLIIAQGAGAMSRQSIGTTVFGGILVATFVTLLVVPTLYIVVEKMRNALGFGLPKA